MNIRTEMKLLGKKVRDVVTEKEGVVISISFDISGCIQGLVALKDPKEGKQDNYWFDTKRLRILDETPVMSQPDFVEKDEVKVPGGHEKPEYPTQPGR